MAKSTNLYHSALVKMGVVTAFVKTAPQKSRFPDKPNYCILVIKGIDYSYNCENQNCESVLAGLVGQTVMIEALGDREQAEIALQGEAQPQSQAPSRTQQRQQPAQQPKQPAKPPQQAPPRESSPAPAVAPMRCSEIRYDRTVNTGNFCNEKVGITIELEPGVKASDALAYAKKFVNEHLAKEAPQHQYGGAKPSTPPPATT